MRMHISAELHLLLVQLVRAHLRHRRPASRRPGTWGPGSQNRRTPPPPAGPGPRLQPRAAHTPEYGPPATSPHSWVRLRDAIRKRSARPSARRGRTPARLPAPHRLFPPYLAHEPSTESCAARRGLLQTPPQGTGPASGPSPAPEAARPVPRRRQGAPTTPAMVRRKPATNVTVARWPPPDTPGVSSGSGLWNFLQAAAGALGVFGTQLR